MVVTPAGGPASLEAPRGPQPPPLGFYIKEKQTPVSSKPQSRPAFFAKSQQRGGLRDPCPGLQTVKVSKSQEHLRNCHSPESLRSRDDRLSCSSRMGSWDRKGYLGETEEMG